MCKHDDESLQLRQSTNHPSWSPDCATQRNAPALPRSKTWWFFLPPPFLRRRSIAGSPGPQGSSGRGPAQSLPFSRLVCVHLFSKFGAVFLGPERGNLSNGGENQVKAGPELSEAVCCLVFRRNAEMGCFGLLGGCRTSSEALIKTANQDDGNPRTESRPTETEVILVREKDQAMSWASSLVHRSSAGVLALRSGRSSLATTASRLSRQRSSLAATAVQLRSSQRTPRQQRHLCEFYVVLLVQLVPWRDRQSRQLSMLFPPLCVWQHQQ